MKTFQLVVDPKILITDKSCHYSYAPVKKVEHIALEDKAMIGIKTKTGWFDKDAPQNLSYKEAGIMGNNRSIYAGTIRYRLVFAHTYHDLYCSFDHVSCSKRTYNDLPGEGFIY